MAQAVRFRRVAADCQPTQSRGLSPSHASLTPLRLKPPAPRMRKLRQLPRLPPPPRPPPPLAPPPPQAATVCPALRQRDRACSQKGASPSSSGSDTALPSDSAAVSALRPLYGFCESG
ncbi:unnamed protein product [Coccothraustes coccothraustes]